MLRYPLTRKGEEVDEYFGIQVPDPYRWLEDDRSEETEEWVQAQNELTFAYLNKIPFRKKLRDRLEALYNYPRLSAPRKVGDYYFFYKNDGLQNQPVIYFQKALTGEAEIFLDPNELSKEGTTSIGLLEASADERYIAYSKSEAGSDWSTIHLIDLLTRQELPDVLQWVKFSGVAWFEDGFFYSRYPAPKEGKEYSESTEHQKVFYHRIGTEQSEDLLIYENPDQPNMYHQIGITEDKAYLILYKSSGTDGFETWFKETDLQREGFLPLYTGFLQKNRVIDHHNGKFLVHTDVKAPNYRLVTVDPKQTAPENWVPLVGQREHVLEDVVKGGGKLFLHYLESAFTHVYQIDYDGRNQKELHFPGPGTAHMAGSKKDRSFLFYTFSSFTYPSTIFQYELSTGESKEFYKPPLRFEPDEFVARQVHYPSKDGTRISMFLVHQRDRKRNGKQPTYLYGYGGFNVPLTPGFSSSYLPFLEQGGILAFPNLRGGSEYGEKWHRAGMLEQKQNVFDDFIAAAEYLIEQGYTSPSHLAIAGGSNGGLLVGACMTQRPDLFAVCLPAVGVLDMLRYHKFTVGWGWIPEYGSAENSAGEFHTLYAYSPLHNLKDGISYPASMITTADHDDRVVPAHSFKFAARLQEAHSGENPVIIRIETDAGHGAGKPISKILDEQADKWSFLLHNTGFEDLSY